MHYQAFFFLVENIILSSLSILPKQALLIRKWQIVMTANPHQGEILTSPTGERFTSTRKHVKKVLSILKQLELKTPIFNIKWHTPYCPTPYCPDVLPNVFIKTMIERAQQLSYGKCSNVRPYLWPPPALSPRLKAPTLTRIWESVAGLRSKEGIYNMLPQVHNDINIWTSYIPTNTHRVLWEQNPLEEYHNISLICKPKRFNTHTTFFRVHVLNCLMLLNPQIFMLQLYPSWL